MSDYEPRADKWIAGEWMRWCARLRHYASRDSEGWTNYGGQSHCPECAREAVAVKGIWNAFMEGKR